jgi:hypothetical protein
MVPPLGWKSECGSAGLAAAEAATDAALAFARQLNEQGTPAVVKVRRHYIYRHRCLWIWQECLAIICKCNAKGGEM